VLAIVALRRPLINSSDSSASTAPTAATSSAPAADAPATDTTPSADVPATASSPAPAMDAPATASPPAPTTDAATTFTDSPTAPPAAGKTVAGRLVFEAKAVVRDGDRPRERKSRVTLAEGRINVRALDNLDLLYVVPYDDVLSISYARGRDPLWNAPTGPARVFRGNGRVFGVLGIFVVREWLSLRTMRVKDQFVVLRFDDELQARRAIAALEERTGRRVQVLADGQDKDRQE
jgi:hypothetical protein